MPVPGAREIGPQDEMARLARERLHGPAKVLHIGDVVRVYDSAGEPFTGRVAAVDRHAVPSPGRHEFSVICAPLEGEQSG